MHTVSESSENKFAQFSNIQWIALILLRVLIGWHFLYEGVVKILNPYWSAAGFLLESRWFMADFFKNFIVANPTALKIVDLLNQWGLAAIGIALIAGIFTRTACVAGMLLLLLYYLSNPPLIGMSYTMPSEGSYLIVNKNLIELAALFVLLLFPTGQVLGLDVLLLKRKKLG